ncbi:hypothetical protein FAZ19_16865 [Sphingobacterium alkalisoli]|uniref:Uncharacterized protein n=1 Tax=Sphingobacterium alkalisoli TaxID=1874115 RepID=A0A4U0GXL3_9SPHI|nr:hypothetical protein [Sphingobacterium alkalisoli]TJY63931.1 hypothetical protein FAZ19_16865 [Sphingobacterium alkalisoli]GGH23978.1 hypothetical protein GCM10011418_31560 [Sphingobacterium alkalisoli]
MMNTTLQTPRLKFGYKAILSVALISMGLISACTKTEITPYEEEPMARISSFKIVNTAAEIVGAINENDKTITLTIPAGQYLNTLEPEITVAEGSTLKEGSDTLITNVLTYFAEGSTREISYPVTATDGSTATYRLLIKTNQPPLLMNEVTTDPTNPVSYDQTNWLNTNYIYIYNTLSTYPYSTNFEFDLELAQASLISQDGTVYKFKLAQSGVPPIISSAYMLLNLNNIEGRVVGSGRDQIYTNTPPEGLYHIKLRYYSRETTLKNPIRIFYNN